MSSDGTGQKTKEERNNSYKKRNFCTALSNNEKAVKLDPNEITYYLNTAAIHFEMKNFTQCVSTCHRAIEFGRDNGASFR